MYLCRVKTEIFIAKKLRLAPSDGGRRSPAVSIAIWGVAIAMIVLMISMSVVLGFQKSIREKVVGFESPLTIGALGRYYQGEEEVVTLASPMRDAIEEALPNARYSLVVKQPVVLKTEDNFAGVILTSFGAEHDFSFEQSNLVEGELPITKTDIVISNGIANKLSLSVGDKLDGCFFVGGALKLRRLTVSGIYSSNFSDYDKLTAYGNMELLQVVRRLQDNEGDLIEIQDVSLESLNDASFALRQALTKRYNSGELTSGVNVATVLDSGAIYFNWLDLLDANVVVILIIMCLVSGFTLISCVFILILQRVRMIGVLKALGATDRQMRRIFMLLGGRVVGMGLIIGNIIGLSLLAIQMKYHVIPLDPEAYFLTYVPVLLDWCQLLILNCGAIMLSALLMLLPASLVSRISPSKTIRYE